MTVFTVLAITLLGSGVVTRPAAPASPERGHDSLPFVPEYALYKVWVETLREQLACPGGCDQRVPQILTENFIEFCGPDYPCDRGMPSWLCRFRGSPYDCSECNGPCGCLVEGRVRLEPWGGHDVIRLGYPESVYSTFRDLRQLRSQYHCFNPATGDSVLGAYEPIITIGGMLPGYDSYRYYLNYDELFVAILVGLTREGLESIDPEETYLRLLSGALIETIAADGPVASQPGYYERAFCLVEWQRAYTLWRRGYDPRSPMDLGFPYEYPMDEHLRQLDEIIYSTCTHPLFEYCTVTATTPDTWGAVKALYR